MRVKASWALGLEVSGRCWGLSSGGKDTEKASGEKGSEARSGGETELGTRAAHLLPGTVDYGELRT